MSKSGSDLAVCEGINCGLVIEWDYEKECWVHMESRTPACEERFDDDE